MSRQLRILAPVIFGAIVAILAITGSDWLVWFAAIGGVLLGLMWVLSKPKASVEQ